MLSASHYVIIQISALARTSYSIAFARTFATTYHSWCLLYLPAPPPPTCLPWPAPVPLSSTDDAPTTGDG